jgi:Mg2+-importing ATPase
MYFVFKANDPEHASLFQTGWFVESLLSQTLIIHIIRTGRVPFLQSMASLPMTVMTVLICAIGCWLPYSPFAHALRFTPLPLTYWPWVGAIVFSYLCLTHVVKTWFIKRFGLG